MSNSNDQSPWGPAATDGTPASDDGMWPDGDATSPAAAHTELDDPAVVDVEHEELPVARKRNALVPVLLVSVGLAAIGGTAAGLYNLYGKLMGGGSTTQAQAGPGGPALIDTNAAAKPPGLAMPGGNGTPAVLPSGSATPDPVASAPAPSAPAHDPAPAPATAVTAAPAVAPAPAPAAPPAAAPAVATAPTQPAAAAAERRPKVAKARPQTQPREEVMVETRPKGPARTASVNTGDSAKRKPQAEEVVTAKTPAPSSLGRYKIESIYPRTGEFQQAWVRDGAGRLRVVRAGDTLDGLRIESVDFKQHAVKTSDGTIR